MVVFWLGTAPPTGCWGSSVHHDSATIIANAFKSSQSIPKEIQENIDTDTIYSLVLAPDDWRNVTNQWGTWQYNMAENAYYEFQRIREAWANGDFDNAIARIGIVMHYVGDAMQMAHSGGAVHWDHDGVRDWYVDHVPPLGSEAPIWADEESGSGEYSHQVRQQIEAYSDSDSAWYPTKPENYGPTDNGCLSWFLDHFYNPVIDNDSPDWNDILASDGTPTVMGFHIRSTSPYVTAYQTPTTQKLDNRWLWWVQTRDPGMSKMDFDNNVRLVYNGVYRALREGEWLRQGNSGMPPDDWSYWPWPTKGVWSSVDDSLYEEGMDTARYYHGITAGGATPAEETQTTSSPISSTSWLLLAIVGVTLIFISLLLWHRTKRELKEIK